MSMSVRLEGDSMLDVEKIKNHGMTSDEYREFLANMANAIITDKKVIYSNNPETIITNRQLLFNVVREIYDTKG